MYIAHFASIIFGLFYVAKYDGETGKIEEFKIYSIDIDNKLRECSLETEYMEIMYEESLYYFQKIILNTIMKK
jgi:hypothetical protein